MHRPSDRAPLVEQRTYQLGVVEFRNAETVNGPLTLTGYASVFGHPYPVFGGPELGGWAETIQPGAFTKTLAERADVQLLINHEGMPLARTKSGTLRLSQDTTGLHVEAHLDQRSSRVQELQLTMERGDMSEMSFAFRVTRQSWSDDQTERAITEVSLHKGDVSVVNYGANDATSTELSARELDLAIAELRAGRVTDRTRAALSVLLDKPTEPAPSRRAMTVAQARTLFGL